MTYDQARRWLHALAPLGVNLGTERVGEVLRRLGDPQRRFAALHIAGTNGKGSTAAMSAALLLAAARAAGRSGAAPQRIGLYTSPHLLRLTERIQISDPAADALHECPPADLAAALSAVRDAAARHPAVALTFFEAITAAAFQCFAGVVQLAVVEVGLGGRLDATRLCQPFVTVVTSIGLDHMELLGPTLTDIAAEKAGIFRPGVPAIIRCADGDALAVLLARAMAVGAPVQPLMPLAEVLAAAVPLAGAHQLGNAALAVHATRLAPGLGPYLADPAVQRDGLRATRWPGRLERLPEPSGRDGVEIRLDAAHNPEGAAALDAWLAEESSASGTARPLTVLFGVVAGKRAGDMLGPLRRAGHVILTRPPSPRGLPAAELAALVGAGPEQAIDSVADALTAALRVTPAGGLLLVYGSIFLIAEVRRLLLDEPADPSPLQDPMGPVQGRGGAPGTTGRTA